MNSTMYVHLQNSEKVAMLVTQLEESHPQLLTINAEGSQVSVFMTPEQILQLQATLGAYISEHPDKFVNKSITKLEEVKND